MGRHTTYYDREEQRAKQLPYLQKTNNIIVGKEKAKRSKKNLLKSIKQQLDREEEPDLERDMKG